MVLSIKLVLRSNRLGIVLKLLCNYFNNLESISNTPDSDTRFNHRLEALTGVRIL